MVVVVECTVLCGGCPTVAVVSGSPKIMTVMIVVVVVVVVGMGTAWCIAKITMTVMVVSQCGGKLRL